jgi:dihydrolipoamide dehydrogenase
MDYDVVIIGGGPAGYVAAIRAGQTGLKTLLVEKEHLGGMCLNWGCIPTKTFLETAKFLKRVQNAKKFGLKGVSASRVEVDWNKLLDRAGKISARLIRGIEYLMKKNGVTILNGEAIIRDANSVTVNDRRISAKYLILATGSVIPDWELETSSASVINVRELMTLDKLPERIVVAGNNAHAIELAQFFRTLGKKVALVYEKIVLPGIDPFLSDFIVKKLEKDGLTLIQWSESISENPEKILNGIPFEYDLIINACSRKGNIPYSDLGLPQKNGFIEVNEYFQAGHENVYAIGDVNGLSYLAHVASAQGLSVINHIHGVKEKLDLKKLPINIYTLPEMAQIGYTEPELKEKGMDFKVSDFPLTANAKSLIEDESEGRIRLLSDNRYGEVLGVQIISGNATDMIGEAAAFMELEGTIYDVARVIHAHPTVSEIFMEAGFEAIDKAIHK